MLTQQVRMEEALAAWEKMPDRAPNGDSVCHLIESFALEEAFQRASSSRPTADESHEKPAAGAGTQDRAIYPRGSHSLGDQHD